MDKKDLFLFIFLTFLITWGIEIPAALESHGYLKIGISRGFDKIATFSPGIVALLLTLINNRWKGLTQLIRSLLRFKVKLKWYGFALLTGSIVSFLAVLIYNLIWKKSLNLPPVYNLFFYLIIFLFFSPFWEELGWRGYLLPRLLKNFSPLKSSLIIGLIWGLWHVPIFFVANVNGNNTLLFTILIFISCFPLSILLTWLYISTRGNVFLCILFHDGINSGIGYFMGNHDNNDLTPFEILVILFLIIAAVLLKNKFYILKNQSLLQEPI